MNTQAYNLFYKLKNMKAEKKKSMTALMLRFKAPFEFQGPNFVADYIRENLPWFLVGQVDPIACGKAYECDVSINHVFLLAPY